MKKVLVKDNPMGIMAIGVVFVAFFIFIALSVIRFMSPIAPSGFTAPFLIFPVLFLVALLVIGAKIITGGRKASLLFNQTAVSETSVSFPEEVDYEVGRLFLEGYWAYSSTTTSSGTTSSRNYHTRRNFRPEKRGRGLEVELPNGPFRVELRADGTGIVDAPAIRIRSGPYKDGLLIFLTDKGEVVGEGSLSLNKGSDTAQVNFRGEGKFLRGSVWAELSKARGVRIEVGSGDVWKRIASGRNFDFSFSTLPEEEIVIFTHYGTVTPLSILKKLWKNSVLLGHGTFELKAVLDVPLARDVVETAVFRVEFEEKQKGV